MQPVIGHIVLLDVVPNLLFRPVRQRVEFGDPAMGSIHFDLGDTGAGYPLGSAEPGDPALNFLEGTAQRFHLSDSAAFVPVVNAMIEKVDPFFADHVFHSGPVRAIDLNIQMVAFPDLIHHLIGFLVQPAGIQTEDPRLFGEP